MDLSIFVTAFSFVLGAVVGSFLNVVIYRTGSGSGFGGRSRCLSCGKALTPRMLVPILSYMLQRGRCAHCGARIPIAYPVVEVAVASLFVLIARKYGLMLFSFDPVAMTLALLDAAIWALLVAVVVYDFRHKIIPDRFALLCALIAGSRLLVEHIFATPLPTFLPLFGATVPVWLEFASGPLMAIPFALLWLFSRGRAMGLGDAKLAWGIGWLSGFSGGISAIVFAFWTAFLPSLILLLLPRKGFTMKSEIPFAPFLVIGAFIVYAWGVDILEWSL